MIEKFLSRRLTQSYYTETIASISTACGFQLGAARNRLEDFCDTHFRISTRVASCRGTICACFFPHIRQPLSSSAPLLPASYTHDTMNFACTMLAHDHPDPIPVLRLLGDRPCVGRSLHFSSLSRRRRPVDLALWELAMRFRSLAVLASPAFVCAHWEMVHLTPSYNHAQK